MQQEPEGTQDSQLCCKGIMGGVRCHSHLHSGTAAMDTELFQTSNTDPKHPEETHKALTSMHPLSVRRSLRPQQNPKPTRPFS